MPSLIFCQSYILTETKYYLEASGQLADEHKGFHKTIACIDLQPEGENSLRETQNAYCCAHTVTAGSGLQ